MSADIWARVDEAIDTDPLQLRDIVAELLARAEQAERELEATHVRAKTAVKRRNDVKAERDALTAAVERVQAKLSELRGGASLGVELDLLSPSDRTVVRHVTSAISAALPAPESPADAPTPVTAATEAHGGAGGAEEAPRWLHDLAQAALKAARDKHPEMDGGE